MFAGLAALRIEACGIMCWARTCDVLDGFDLRELSGWVFIAYL